MERREPRGACWEFGFCCFHSFAESASPACGFEASGNNMGRGGEEEGDANAGGIIHPYS